MEIVLNPMLGSKIEYVWFSHPKPWRMSCGAINRAKIDDGLMKVSFTVSRREAMKHPKWDAINNRLLIEVLDKDDRVVIDNWLEFKDKKVLTATLCLGDNNAK